MIHTPGSVLEAARDLGPLIREHADEGERIRRLAPRVVDAFIDTGIFKLCVPEEYGGAEADPATTAAVIEELSRADGSAGWCAMIAGTTGTIAAPLQPDVAEEVFGHPRAVAGGVVAPGGRAERAEGGWRVTGRWAFASGVQHSTWLVGTCLVADEPPRMMLFPAGDVRVIDTWTVSGLCGTGSNDYAVDDVLVPDGRSFQFGLAPRVHSGPLYAFPLFGLLSLGVCSVALGVARRAIEELVDLAGAKTPFGSRRALAQRTMAQVQLAEAEAALESARALLYQTVDRIWQVVLARGEIPVEDRARLRLACTNATWSSARAVDLMYAAGGGSSIYATSPLQRCFRDVHAITQHVSTNQATLETIGRVLMGVEGETGML